MKDEKRDFNKEAATWDEPRRERMNRDIASAIQAEIQLRKDMNVLDFGCGTGLLTMCLQPQVASVTCIDSSRGMLDILEKKISAQEHCNVKTLHIDLDDGGRLEGHYDLITSSMALHHVRNIQPLLDQFYAATADGGHLCIADLDLENGLFHAENHTGVFHDGFGRTELHEAFSRAGYVDVCDRTATTILKPVPGGAHEFTIFLMAGRK
jgi:cyclopropane fatty-acyl-phospholipid synthase-like methyltransferase